MRGCALADLTLDRRCWGRDPPQTMTPTWGREMIDCAGRILLCRLAEIPAYRATHHYRSRRERQACGRLYKPEASALSHHAANPQRSQRQPHKLVNQNRSLSIIASMPKGRRLDHTDN